MIEIREAASKKDIKKFIDYPQKLYKDCPYFVPFLRMDEINMSNPKKNASLEVCKVKYFLAYKGGEIVGRVLGIIHFDDIKKTGVKRVRFSRIDFIDDIEVARALIKAVEEFGKAEGMEYIHGPLGFNDLDREGLLTEGFDRISTFEEQYSYPYYPVLLEKLGFEKDVDWISMLLKCPPVMDARIERISERVLKKYDLRVARFKSKNEFINKYGRKFFRAMDECYSGLYATVPFSEKVIDNTIKMFKLIADLKLICVVVDKDDNIVAGGMALANIAKAVQKSKGRLGPLGIIRLLWAVKHYEYIDFAFIGVLPEYLNKGVNSIVITEIVKGGIARRVKGAETNLMLEFNNKVQSQFSFLEGERHKRRRAYIKPIR